MTKKAKEQLEKELTQHVSKRYPDQIEKVVVKDKRTCVITVESRVANQRIDITLPIAALGYQVQGS